MLKLFKCLTKKEWAMAFIGLCFIVLQVYLELTMPDYMAEITKLVSAPGGEIKDVLIAGAKMLGFAFGSLLCSVIVAVISAKIAAEFSAELRGRLFKKVNSFSMEEIGRFSTASLITRSTNDVTQVQMLIVMGLQVVIRAPIMAVWAIIKIAGKEWEWTLATAVAVIVLLVVVIVCTAIALPKFKKMQKLSDNLNRTARENLIGINVVRAYNAEEYQQNKFEKANEEFTQNNLFTQKTMAFLMPTIQIIMSGISLSVYWIGAVLLNNAALYDKMDIFADMMVFSQYAVMVVMSFMMLVMIFMLLPRAQVAAGRINEVLETETAIKDGTETSGKEGVFGRVEFKNVGFAYPDAAEAVISGISFTAERGQTVALIGATGCGKSTVINLIPRFYDATSGEVLVDGVNVKDYKQSALRDKIGYVSQKAVLFSGTVKENIDFGGAEIKEEEISSALLAAKADFLQEKEGIASRVSQGGVNFSGGQKQRLSIARALAKNPEILVFDDSFSALDYKTDREIRDKLKTECKDCTKIIVAQRIGTVIDADKILVIENGKIAGEGTHEKLLKTCEVYKEIAKSQLSEEELKI